MEGVDFLTGMPWQVVGGTFDPSGRATRPPFIGGIENAPCCRNQVINQIYYVETDLTEEPKNG